MLNYEMNNIWNAFSFQKCHFVLRILYNAWFAVV